MKKPLLSLLLLCVSSVRASDTLRIAFTGDVLLDRGVRREIRYRGGDALFSPRTDSLFATCSRVVVNLECPVTELRRPLNKRFIFRGDTTMLPVLRRHGVTHLNMANNHTIDQGRDGLMDTWRNILRSGMTAIGVGESAARAACPVLIATQPRNVYVLSSLLVMSENYVYMPSLPSVSEISVAALCDSVRTLKSAHPDAVVVVCLHWGVEHTVRPRAEQIRQAHLLIDAGADAVIGAHTHTLQPVETYRRRPIFYSLGNFIFDPLQPLNTHSAVAVLTVTPSSLDFSLVPFTIHRCTPE